MGLNWFGWAFLLGSPRAVVNHPRWGSSPCLRLGHRGCRPADLDVYCFFLHLVTLFWVGGWASPPPRGYFGIWDPLWGTCLRLGPGMLSPGGFAPAATQHPCRTLPRNVPPLHPHSYPHCGAPRGPVLVLDLNAQNENRDIAADSRSSSLTFPKAFEGRQICFVFLVLLFCLPSKAPKDNRQTPPPPS